MMQLQKNICNTPDQNGFFHFYSSVLSNTVFMKMATDSEVLTTNNIYKVNMKNSENNQNMSILHTNDALDKYTEYIYAVADPLDKHRFFIGVIFRGYYTSMLVSGMFLYFDNDGNNLKKTVMESILCNYDCRNGKIDETNTYLYNQTLLMTQMHRDSNTQIITLACFDYNDTLLGISMEYTDIKCGYSSTPIIRHNRWLTYTDVNTHKYIIINLGSVYVSNEKQEDNYYSVRREKHICYYVYIYNDNVNIDNTIMDLNTTIKENPYDDGYPLDCIKCGNRLEIATLNIGILMQTLGCGYCNECRIRYSKSSNAWICCDFIEHIEYNNSIDICSNRLNKENDYICDEMHICIPVEYRTCESEYKPYKNITTLVIDTNYIT